MSYQTNKNGDKQDSLLRQARQWSLSQGKVLSGRMTACDPRGTCVQASAVGGTAPTASPSIRCGPWHLLKWLLGLPSIGQHYCHQRVTKIPFFLSAFNIKTPTKHLLWIDQRTRR